MDYFRPVDGDLEAQYIGLTVEQAQDVARQSNIPFRIVVRDGECQTISDDVSYRLNAAVEGGIVTAIRIG